jgi:small subunit ribosomal protein S21
MESEYYLMTNKKHPMLIVEVKENIDRALKRYKRKVRSVRLYKELRRRKFYTKPSEKRRNEIKQAIYTEQYLKESEL